MAKAEVQGVFKVIESFAIKRKNEFYLIGKLISGTVKEQWFVSVVLNSSLSITLRISEIEEVEITNEKESYTLLVIQIIDYEEFSLLLGLNISNELMNITIDGED